MTIRNLLQNCETLLVEAINMEDDVWARGMLFTCKLLISEVHGLYIRKEAAKGESSKVG